MHKAASPLTKSPAGYDPHVSRRARWIVVLCAAYTLAIAAVGLWPSHVDQNVDIVHNAPAQWLLHHLNLTNHQGYDVAEFGANVLWFVPFGLLLQVIRPRWSWLTIVLAGALVSTTIEILQAVARPGRTADPGDVLANTIGVALGCLAYAVVRRRRASDPAGS